jgi:preprotein translocase subunit SecG
MLLLVRFLLGSLLFLTSLFLILLVLIQRGRGGGLAGAFGGAGGQSAFGTKAGDTFTKITIGVAAFWIVLCILSINVLATPRSRLSGSLGSDAPMAVEPGPTAEANAPPPAPDSTDNAEAPAPPASSGEATAQPAGKETAQPAGEKSETPAPSGGDGGAGPTASPTTPPAPPAQP